MTEHHDELVLRALEADDLPTIALFLAQPYVARWWLERETIDEVIAKYKRRVEGQEPTTHMLAVVCSDRMIGWCQWYLLSDYPEHSAEIGAQPEDAGIDYAIGVPSLLGRGIGSRLVRALVAEVRRAHPSACVLVDPDSRNAASRRALERCGFRLADERMGREGRVVAVYRLSVWPTTGD